MRRSFLFSFLIGFCGGIVLAEIWRPSFIILGLVASVCFVLNRWANGRIIAAGLIALSLGMFRLIATTTPGPNSIVRQAGRAVEASGDVLDLPSEDQDQTIVLSRLTVGGRAWSGKLQVTLPRYPRYDLGRRLTVRCPLEVFPPAQRLRRWAHGLAARCFQATVISISDAPPSLRLGLGRILATAVDLIHRNFSEPQASLLGGIIFGSQTEMPDDLRRDFQATGTTHIVALSGFNVTIIVTAVMQLLVRLIGRRRAWIPSLVLVVAFVVMTGASASVVRAAAMAIIVHLGLFLGRPIHPTRLLSYAAMLMLWQNPLVLLHDLGFQLSFLATAGLVFLSKPAAERLSGLPAVGGLRENLATTLSAIIATEPLLLWRFSRLSLIAPIVNLLVVPLIPLSMGLGSLWLFGQLMHPLIGNLVQPATDALLRLIVWLIVTGADTSWSAVSLSGWPAGIIAAAFVALIITLRRTHDPEVHPA